MRQQKRKRMRFLNDSAQRVFRLKIRAREELGMSLEDTAICFITNLGKVSSTTPGI
jgi:predicted hydrolase (HD superfamily)